MLRWEESVPMLGRKCTNKQTHDKFYKEYFPPPWNADEHPKKTEGWIEFQEEMHKNPAYYLLDVINYYENALRKKEIEDEINTKITIEYNLPRDSCEYQIFHFRNDFYECLCEIDQFLRNISKHGDCDIKAELADEIRAMIANSNIHLVNE